MYDTIETASFKSNKPLYTFSEKEEHMKKYMEEWIELNTDLFQALKRLMTIGVDKFLSNPTWENKRVVEQATDTLSLLATRFLDSKWDTFLEEKNLANKNLNY